MGGGLLIVVTIVILSCVLILRKVYSTTQSKYIPDVVYANSVVCLSHLSTCRKYLKSNYVYYTFKLSIKFPDKPLSTKVSYSLTIMIRLFLLLSFAFVAFVFVVVF